MKRAYNTFLLADDDIMEFRETNLLYDILSVLGAILLAGLLAFGFIMALLWMLQAAILLSVG